ncbi:MAG: acetyltransferase [Clostridia bacterium]|jgi:multimeric flavodoxin WrbA|nr:acetyltransferase [Clostridia bacterium]
MKTLIINGSPRKNGDSMTLVHEMMKHLQGEVTIIHTYDADIKPCTDCRYCWQNNGCSIKDGMQEVYRLLNEVDNVILSSPIYFSELTGELLSFASRLQLFYVSKRIRKDNDFNIKKKNGAVVISAGGDTKNLECANRRADIIFKHMNTTSIGSTCTLNTNEIPAKEDYEAMIMARELALKLNELYLAQNE